MNVPTANSSDDCAICSRRDGLMHGGEANMIVGFCKWGNNLAVRIPKALADAIKATAVKRAEINVENGTLVLLNC
jgi:hypothetical protein